MSQEIKIKSRWFSYLVFMFLCVICVLVGGYGGAFLAAGNIVNNWIISQTSSTRSHIEILKLLRNGEQDTALEQLEARLDKDIVSLSPEYYDEFRITEQTRARIETALHQAKEYRQSYPRPSQGRAIDKDVEKTLSSVED